MIVVGRGDEAALGDVYVTHVGVVGRDAHNVGIFEALVAGAHVHVVVIEGGDRLGGLHVGAQALVVFHGDQRALLGFHPGVLAGDDAETVDDEDVGAEVGDAVGHVEVHAGDHAHDGDEGGDGEDDAEQSQEAAEFVGAKGVEGEAHGLHHGDRAGAKAGERRGTEARADDLRDACYPLKGSYTHGDLVFGTAYIVRR